MNDRPSPVFQIKSFQLKVLHIGEIPFPIPWSEWQSLLQSQLGVSLSLEQRNDFSEGLSPFQTFDAARITREWAQEAYGFFSAKSPLIRQLQYLDFVYKKDGVLWPHLLHKEALRSAIVAESPYLNTKASGLIVGSTEEALQAAFVLAEMGFRHIAFVVEAEEEGQRLLGLLRSALFDMQFEFITHEKVILLPGIFSIVLFYENLKGKEELLTSILYFNYLEPGGLVVNAGAPLEDLTLLSEAKAIGAKTLELDDLHFFEEIFALKKFIPINQEKVQLLLGAVQGGTRTS